MSGKKAEFSDEILNYIASNIQRNIRQLEGALNVLIAHQKLQQKQLDLKTVKSLLKDFTSSEVKVISAKTIIRAVAEFYDLKEKDILSVSRRKEIVKPRQIAMYLLRTTIKSSFPLLAGNLAAKIILP